MKMASDARLKWKNPIWTNRIFSFWQTFFFKDPEAKKKFLPHNKEFTMIFSVLSIVMVSSAMAQGCTPDATVDDFSKLIYKQLPTGVNGALENKTVDLLGGDYGSKNAEFVIDPTNKVMTVTVSKQGDEETPETNKAGYHPNPNTAPTYNYWFLKFDENACFDLSGYEGFGFDLVAPTGSDMNFTLTQKSPDCTDRLYDSVYHPLTKYITPNGHQQKVFLPFSDFAQNLNGNAFDFKHLKDFTAVNLMPYDGTQFVFSNLVLKGNCSTAKNTNSSSNTAQNGTKSNNAETMSSASVSFMSVIVGVALSIFA